MKSCENGLQLASKWWNIIANLYTDINATNIKRHDLASFAPVALPLDPRVIVCGIRHGYLISHNVFIVSQINSLYFQILRMCSNLLNNLSHSNSIPLVTNKSNQINCWCWSQQLICTEGGTYRVIFKSGDDLRQVNIYITFDYSFFIVII